MNLSKFIKITPMLYTTEVAVGSTATTSETVLDMAGFDGVLFLDIPHGVVASGKRYIYALSGDSSGTLAASTESYTGTTGAVTTTGMSQGAVDMLDIYKPVSRYVSVAQVRATQNSAGGVWAIQYASRVLPVANTTAGVLDSSLVLGLDT